MLILKRFLQITYNKITSLLKRIHDGHRTAPLRTLVVLCAFFTVVFYASVYQITPSVDARRYHTVATNLVTLHSYCETCDGVLSKDTAIHGVGPGYQFFLAGVYWIFGVNLWAIWLVQALLHAVVVYWLWLIIERYVPALRGRPRVTAFFCMLYAIHPDVVQIQAMVMSEGFFIFLLVASTRLLDRVLESGGRVELMKFVSCGILGLLLGALTMTRPTGFPVLLLFLSFILWKKWYRKALVVVACFVAIQAPWAVRNFQVYDHLVYNSVLGGWDLWVGLDPYSPGEFDMDKLPHIAQKIEGLDADEIDRVSLAEVKKILQEQPAFALGRTFEKGLKLFALTKTSAFWFHYRSTVDQLATLILSIGFNAVIWLAAFACIVEAVRRRLRPPLLAVGVIFLLAMTPTLTVVVNRYRIPMLPFAILLGAFWYGSTHSWRERSRSLLLAGVILFVCTVADIRGSFEKITERIQRLGHTP